MLHISASGWILTRLQSATSRPTDDDAKNIAKNNSALWVRCTNVTDRRQTD